MGPPVLLSQRGFTLPELVLTIALAVTVLGISAPVMRDVTDTSRLNAAARELERELQDARLKAVSSNRILRLRINCPATGYYRTVEFLGSAAQDSAANRCSQTVYPYPAPDHDLMTRPNHDGPLRVITPGTTVDTLVLQFHPDGTAQTVSAGVAQRITNPVTVTVRRGRRTRAVTINGAGKIQLA
jgi:prepilin-type N-terminal cleavage/methylation domain-containing protein